MSKKLFENSDESEEETVQLCTNKDYAKTYNHLRRKELAQKLKDRGLNDADSATSSDSDDSSDEDEVLDVNFDREFFKTLSSLKSKDPAIYDKNMRFFETTVKEQTEQNASGSKKPAKPVTLKDYERKILLERAGKFEDDSGEEAEVIDDRAESPTIVEEERRLKAEFKKVLTAEDSEEEEFGGIFKKRQKTKEEEHKEEEDFLKWLAGKKEDVADNVKQQLKPLKSYWSSNNLTQSERFLRDYVLNKGYADTKFAEIPTYDEIVGDTQQLSEDEQELEKQAEFEQKYNFRFEEPDQDFIKRYPRTIENSVRRTDEKRKQKRHELKERKLQEKEEKMKELEIIKEMKRQEIQEKIRKLKLITGNEELGFKDDELEEDFDPEAHDKRMQEIFNDEYYQVDEGEEKPECPSDIEELKLEDWDNYDPKRMQAADNDYNDNEDDDEQYCEDEDFNMDCDYDPAAAKEQMQKELIENTKRRKNRRGRKNRFMEIIQAEKPVFNPDDEKTYGDYIDEYYKLDCEDVIADLPCRFKYVETTPNDFGLSIEEILLAKNKELNQWASLKKAVQIRPESVEKKEQRLYKLKAKNEDLKRKIFKSLYGEGSDEEVDNEDAPLPAENANANVTTVNASFDDAINKTGKKKKRKRQANANQKIVDKQQNQQQQSNANMDEVPAVKQLKIEAAANPEGNEPVMPNNTQPSNTTNQAKKKKRKNNANHKETLSKLDVQTKDDICNAKKSQMPEQTNPLKLNKKQTNENASTKQNTKLNGKQWQKPFAIKPNENPKKLNVVNDAKISDERLKAYGINPKKFHKKQKYAQNKKKCF